MCCVQTRPDSTIGRLQSLAYFHAVAEAVLFRKPVESFYLVINSKDHLRIPIMSLWVYLLVFFAILFAFTDAWYFVRYFFSSYLRKWRRSGMTMQQLFAPTVTSHIVLPSDIDLWMHMNNSKYLREADFGRLNNIIEHGIYQAIHDLKAFAVAGSVSIRYRREFRVFQRYNIETRMLHFDDSSVYVEQQFKCKGFVHAVVFVQVRFVHSSPAKVFEHLGCGKVDVPATVERQDLLHFIQYNVESSKHLRPAKSS